MRKVPIKLNHSQLVSLSNLLAYYVAFKGRHCTTSLLWCIANELIYKFARYYTFSFLKTKTFRLNLSEASALFQFCNEQMQENSYSEYERSILVELQISIGRQIL